MEKVKVNKEIKKELDEAYFWLGKINVKRKLINAYYNGVCNFKKFDCPKLLNLDENIFYSILANGYELEETKEEKLDRIYEENKSKAITTKIEKEKYYSLGVIEGIRLSKEIYNE